EENKTFPGHSSSHCKHMDIHKMRIAAAEFYRRNGVPAIIERALNELFLRQPADVHGYLANFFLELSTPPRISDLRGREVFSENGQLIVEVEVFSIVCNKEKVKIIQKSSTTSTQMKNNLYVGLQDTYLTLDMFSFRGKKPLTFHLFFYISGKKSVVVEKQFPPPEPPEPLLLEGMAVGSVSLAVAKSGAKIKGMPLYKYISDPTHFHVPVPWITLLSCGKKSPGKLCLLEEIILISKVGHPVKQVLISVGLCECSKITLSSVSHNGVLTASCERPDQPLDLITNACTNLKVPLGVDVFLALNCAAPKLVDYSKGKYEVATGGLKSPDELIEVYNNLISKYPAVVAVIDPFRREVKQWKKLSDRIGISCSLLSDITHKAQAPALPGVHGYVFRHANETTVSDIIHATFCYQGTRWEVLCAVGLGLDYVKLGGLGGAETMAKYNRLISIEEELAQQGLLGRCFSVLL
uniref:Enolase 4 n=1 Tax=Poecilia latipinna TaxID=48699 RepID=A0A3B3TWG8_9TELE